MKTSVWSIVAVSSAVLAASCSSSANDATTSQTVTTVVSPDHADGAAPSDGEAPIPSTTAATELDAWVLEVERVLASYHDDTLSDADLEPSPEDSPLVGQLKAGLVAGVAADESALAALPAEPTQEETADPYGDLVNTLSASVAAGNAVIEAIDADPEALEQELTVTGAMQGSPLLPGTSLNSLMERLREASIAITDACFALDDALKPTTDVRLDCTGAAALVPEGAEAAPPGEVIDVPGVAIEIRADSEQPVVPHNNGVEFLGYDACVWIGRPAAFADPAGPAGFLEIAASIPVPADPAAWIESHPGIELSGPGPADSPLGPAWDASFSAEHPIFVFIDTEPSSPHPVCNQIGPDQQLRLRVLPTDDGPVATVILTLGAGTSLDELDAVLDTFSLVR